jgi:protease-4
MRGYSPGERAALMGAIRQFYSLFLRRVAEGRGRAVEAIEPHAEGRVWTGAQAEARGLVDRLGHEHEALAWLEERSGADASRGLLLFGPRRPWLRRILGSLLPGAGAELPWALRALVARVETSASGGVDATCEVRWSA